MKFDTLVHLVGFPIEGNICLVNVVCGQIEVSLSVRSPVQGSPTDCGMSECDSEVSLMSKFWPTRHCGAMEEKIEKKV